MIALDRLRHRTPRELRFRATQWFGAALERSGLAADLRTTQVDDTARPAVPSWGEPAATARRAAALDAGTAERLTAQAKECLAGRYRLLGLSPADLGTEPDWQHDWTSGRRAPMRHWSRVPYLDPSVVGDHKVVWELNRLQFLVRLAQAYLLHDDAHYARGAAHLMTAWMRGNPPKQGINWVSSLELGYRSIAWTWALVLLGDAVPAAVRSESVAMLRLHGRHVARNLSYYFSPNTHLTGEALALLYLGSTWAGWREAAEWRALGWRILREELPRQVHPDGVYGEQSLYYQRYVADIYLHAMLLRRTAGDEVDPATTSLVGRVCDVLAATRRPDGSIPLVGDEDGGELLNLGGAPSIDVRPTLALAALVLERPDLGQDLDASAWASAAWLCGSATQPSRQVPMTPRALDAFPAGGMFVLRPDGADRSSFLVFDAGPMVHPRMGGAHAHADALAIDLTVGGTPVLVDPGTGSYSDAALRRRLREAGAHNGLLLDGGAAAMSDGPFRWRNARDARPVAWTSGSGHAAAAGEWDGLLADGTATHRRTVLSLAGIGWIVRDQLGITRPHDVALAFHLSPAARPAPTPAGWALELDDGASVELVVAGGDGLWSELPDIVAPAYGSIIPSRTLRWATRLESSATIWTAIIMGSGCASPVSAGGGLALSWSSGTLVVQDHGPTGSGIAWAVHEAAGGLRARGEADLAGPPTSTREAH